MLKDLPDVVAEEYEDKLEKLKIATKEIFGEISDKCLSLDLSINCLLSAASELIGSNIKKEKLDEYLKEVLIMFVINTRLCSEDRTVDKMGL